MMMQIGILWVLGGVLLQYRESLPFTVPSWAVFGTLLVLTSIIAYASRKTTAGDNRVAPTTETEEDSPTPTSTGSVNATASGWSGVGWIVALLLVILIGGGSWWAFQRSTTLKLSPEEIATQKEEQQLLAQGWVPLSKKLTSIPDVISLQLPKHLKVNDTIVFYSFRWLELYNNNGVKYLTCSKSVGCDSYTVVTIGNGWTNFRPNDEIPNKIWAKIN